MLRSLSLSLLCFTLFAFGAVAADPPTKVPMEKREQAVIGLADCELLKDGKGMLVKGVVEDGPSAKLASGDVILAIEGYDFQTWREWFDLLNDMHKTNKGKVTLTVQVKATGKSAEITIAPNVAEIEVPVAPPGLRRLRLLRIEEPNLPDLTPAKK